MNTHRYYIAGIVAITINLQAAMQGIPYAYIDGLPPIYLDPLSETIGHTWDHGMVWDKSLIQKFYSLLPKDEQIVVFDLGAQTGSFSLMAKYFPLSVWHAFEPIQEAVDVLKSNLALNAIQNVMVHPLAVTDFSGVIDLIMPDRANWGLSTVGQNVLRFTPRIKREVAAIDLDAFVEINHINKVHFMKLDTEGAELSILRGAQKMIQRDHPVMIIEYYETNMKQCNVSKQDLDDFLEQMGYKWHFISNDDVLCTPVGS